MRWGLGPVFIYECLANSRRWQTYAVRSVGVAMLLAAVATIAVPRLSTSLTPANAWREYAALGESYFYAVIGVELTLVLLAAPAATAGAICVDRARGTLMHMLATDLSDPEIVLGKLAARLLPILGLVACSWPVMALSSLLGGIDPTALTLAFAIILAAALLGCTMAMALSVWARKPHEVVLVVYSFWALVLLVWPIWFALGRTGIAGPPAAWSLVVSPYHLAFAPYYAPGRVGFWDYFGFFAVALGASALFSVLAVWRMRPVARRGTDDRRREPRIGLVGQISRWLPGPSLDGNPVLWREWHRSRPSRWLMILIVLVGSSTGIACIVGAVMTWAYGLGSTAWPPGVWWALGILGFMLQLVFGVLMLSAVAPMSMSEERQRGSLDLLAATTLSTRTIVLGKWLGTLRQLALLVIGPGLMGFALATAFKAPMTVVPKVPPRYLEELSQVELLFGATLMVVTILVHGALIASVGLAMATWIARPSRAIALSVGLTVMMSVGWPILIGVLRMRPEQGLMCLSPILAAFDLAGILSSRFRYQRDTLLWWITFWDIECLVLALGLLWLTVRTFDRCFGRIPERDVRAPILSDIIAVLAALIGAGGLFGVFTTRSIKTWEFMDVANLGVMACIFLVTVGFVLVAALASSSMSRRETAPAMALEPAAAVPDRRFFTTRWWASFRLVLLLAIGPSLLALGLAMAPIPFRVVTKVTPGPGGSRVKIETDYSGITYVTTTDASGQQTTRNASEAEIAAAEPAPPAWSRVEMLTIAAVAVGTILAHGAAFVSLGLMLGTWIRSRGWAIAASVGLVLFVTVGWPILYLTLRDSGYYWASTLASVLTAFSELLFCLTRPDAVPAMTGWAGFWDAIMILAAVIASGLAIRTLNRRSRGCPSAKADAAHVLLQPALGESGSASI
jgi:ABC-type transport system involved in multi-copper enzyme maturation permease subunit